MKRTPVEVSGAMEWQPIETAPKDGTRLWLYWPSRYKDDCQVVGWFYSSSDEFYWTDFNDTERPRDPTHWMPLPPPPIHHSNL